jgi:hypothetical protein
MLYAGRQHLEGLEKLDEAILFGRAQLLEGLPGGQRLARRLFRRRVTEVSL